MEGGGRMEVENILSENRKQREGIDHGSAGMGKGRKGDEKRERSRSE